MSEPATDALWFTGELSPTPLADEYRRIETAFQRGAIPSAALDPGSHAPETIAKARDWWLAMMRAEYESSSTFVEMAMLFRLINDPLDIQVVTLRMAQDELRHAAICARVIAALGSSARIQPAAPRTAPPHPDCGPEEWALRSVIFGCCISEMVNAARLAKRFSETTFEETVLRACIPGLERFGIDAGEAWEKRSVEPLRHQGA